MRMLCFLVIGLLMLCIASSCGGDEEKVLPSTPRITTPEPPILPWEMTMYDPTGIDPTVGLYLKDGYTFFEVILSEGKKYLRFSSDNYRFDNIEITNGSFYHEWGELGEYRPSGSNHPTDSYALSGHFTSKTEASGQVKYAYAGKITGEDSFVAELKIP